MNSPFKFSTPPRQFSRGLAYRLWFAGELDRVRSNCYSAALAFGCTLGAVFMFATSL